MTERTEVVVDNMRVSLVNQHRIVLLKEKDGPLYLPLYIGQFEAEAIILSLQEIEISRPQTHDLIRSILKALGGRILYVEITELKTATFYAEIVIENEKGEVSRIDSRPSDAIAAALRSHVPIYVDRDVMLASGIQPEQDVRQRGGNTPTANNPDEDDLSAFKDFFDNINF